MPSSCVSGVEDTANNVRVKIGVDGRSLAAVTLGASVVVASVVGTSVVVRVGNTGGTGASWSETGNVALAVEHFCCCTSRVCVLRGVRLFDGGRDWSI